MYRLENLLFVTGRCIRLPFFFFFSLTRYLCWSQTFHFSRDVCWPVVLMLAPVCMTKRKTCSHVRAKYRGREKKCENKNGKICFTFLSWKGWTIVIKKTLPLKVIKVWLLFCRRRLKRSNDYVLFFLFVCFFYVTKGIGWIYDHPALSCKNIRDVGDSKGDGKYCIDPAKNGKPFKVYCDMTTDGGLLSRRK